MRKLGVMDDERGDTTEEVKRVVHVDASDATW